MEARLADGDEGGLEQKIEHPEGENEAMNMNQQAELRAKRKVRLEVIGAAEADKDKRGAGQGHGEVKTAVCDGVILDGRASESLGGQRRPPLA